MLREQFLRLNSTLSCKKIKYEPYFFIHNNDSSKILLVKLFEFEKDEPEKWGIKVADASLNTVWEKDIVLPYENSKTGNLMDMKIDSKGNLYMLTMVENTSKDKTLPPYYFEIISYDYQKSSMVKKKIDLGNDYTSSIKITLNDNDQLIGGGFYSDKGKGTMKGSFYFTYDIINSSLSNINTTPFSGDLYNKFVNGSKTKDGQVMLKNYKVRNLFVSVDKLILISEYFDYDQRTSVSSSSGKTTVHQTWTYGDVFITETNLTNNTTSFTVVNKSQGGTRSGTNTLYYESFIDNMFSSHEIDDFTKESHPARYFGIAALFNGKQAGIIYNDAGSSWSLLNSTTVLTIVNPDGSTNKVDLFKTKDSQAKQQSYVIILAQARKYYRLIKVGM